MQNAIKQLFIAGLFALATLLLAIAPAHAQATDAEVQADLLQTRIFAAIEGKAYAAADALFAEYEALGVVMPPPLQFQRAIIHARLERFYKAELELKALVKRAERGSPTYNKALQFLTEIAPLAAADTAGKAQAAAKAAEAATAAEAAEAEAAAADRAYAAAWAKQHFDAPLSVTATVQAPWAKKGKDMASFLHFAVILGQPFFDLRVAKWLLDNGADVNALGKSSFRFMLIKYTSQATPLHWAADADGDNTEAIQLLLDYGADVNAKEKGNATPGATPLDRIIGRGGSPENTALLRAHGGLCNREC